MVAGEAERSGHASLVTQIIVFPFLASCVGERLVLWAREFKPLCGNDLGPKSGDRRCNPFDSNDLGVLAKLDSSQNVKIGNLIKKR